MPGTELGERVSAVVAGVAPLPAVERPALAADAALDELVYSLLLWNASHAFAAGAAARLTEAFVDLNEMRVALRAELMEAFGKDDPAPEPRADALRDALTGVFESQNGLSMAGFAAVGKREARQKLEAVPGLPAFCAARVLLLSLGAHAFPVDDRLHALLTEHGLVDEGDTPEATAAKLERAVRAGDAFAVYQSLEALAEAKPATAPKRGARGGSRKKSARSKPKITKPNTTRADPG